MTGAIAALTTIGGLPSAIGSVVTPAALSWNDIYAEDTGSTQTLLVADITTSIQVSASKTGGARLAYILNGTYAAYSGGFTVHPDDALGWSVISTSTNDQSGVVTVTNMTSGATLNTFNYTVYSSRGSRL